MKIFLAILLLAVIVCHTVKEELDLKGWTKDFSEDAKEFMMWLIQNPSYKKYFSNYSKTPVEYAIKTCKSYYYKPDKCESIITNIVEVFNSINGNK